VGDFRVFQSRGGWHKRRDNYPPELTVKTLIELAEKRRREPTLLDELLDEYAADVLNYVNSAGDSFSPERNVPGELRYVHREIKGLF
jgi:hypothetical protein